MKQAFLDHIGIAVLPNSPLAKLFAVLGLTITHKEVVEREKVETQWIPMPVKQGNIELLLSLDSNAAVGKFLEKAGRDGIHHLCFRVESIADSSAALAKAGFRLIYPEAKKGAHDCLVNFVHPSTTGGVLIEISEKDE